MGGGRYRSNGARLEVPTFFFNKISYFFVRTQKCAKKLMFFRSIVLAAALFYVLPCAGQGPGRHTWPGGYRSPQCPAWFSRTVVRRKKRNATVRMAHRTYSYVRLRTPASRQKMSEVVFGIIGPSNWTEMNGIVMISVVNVARSIILYHFA